MQPRTYTHTHTHTHACMHTHALAGEVWCGVVGVGFLRHTYILIFYWFYLSHPDRKQMYEIAKVRGHS